MAETKPTKAGLKALTTKLLEVRKSVDYLQKSASGSQFKYTSSSQVLSAVREKMNELGLVLVASIVNTQLHSTLNKKDVMVHFTELWMTMTWVDTDTGETIEIPWYGQGVDLAGEKGVGKALTYAEKYFILKQFNIPTDKDDPDAFQEKNAVPVAVEEVIKQALKELEGAKTKEEVTALWNKYPKLKKEQEFIDAVKEAGTKFVKEEPKDDKK